MPHGWLAAVLVLAVSASGAEWHGRADQLNGDFTLAEDPPALTRAW